MGWLRKLFTAAIVVLISVAGLFYCAFRPSHTYELIYDGQPIHIMRDAQNIPFIDAKSWRGFMYGWGHSVAEDRLFQISFKQVIAEGTLSQYMGERTLEVDRFMRELNLDEWSVRMERRLKREDPQEYLNL